MRKIKIHKLMFAMLTAVVMLFALTGCGDVEKGTYKLTGISYNNNSLNEDELRAKDINALMEVGDGKKVTIWLNNESNEAEIEGSGDDMKLKIGDNYINVKYENNKLSFEYEGAKMVFEKK